MNAKERNRFYLMWTLAIILCALLCLFILIYASFGGGAKAPSSPSPTEAISTEG